MTVLQILGYLLVWTTVGVIGFSLYVVVVFRTGIVNNTRNQDGLLKDKQDLSGILSSLSLLLLILLLQLFSNYWLLVIQQVPVRFPGLLILNYVLYLLLFLFVRRSATS